MSLRGKVRRLSLLGILTLPLPGCAVVRRIWPATPVSSVTLGDDTRAESKGPAGSPASLSTTRTTSSLTLPAGSTLNLGGRSTGEPPGVASAVATLAAPSALSVVTETKTAQTATPPAPPSVADTARADALASFLRYFLFAGLACGLLAALAFYTQHYLAGICLAGAAVFLPVLAHFVSMHAALVVGVALVAVAVTLVLIWYSHVKPISK